MTQPILPGFSDQELLRYSRHILLDDIGIEGQTRIASASVLIVGAGGLGCPSALYLAAAGVGHLVVADDDQVDLTNLQRQVLHTTARIGQPKVQSAKRQINELNPHVQVDMVSNRLENETLSNWVSQVNLVLDCSDNFKTRHAVNRACVQFRKPLVSGAAIRLDGQLACFELSRPTAPCYHCLFPEDAEVTETRCASMGVLASVTGVIGTLQATEALKILGGFGSPLYSSLQIYDARTGTFTTMKIRKDPHCPVCKDMA